MLNEKLEGVGGGGGEGESKKRVMDIVFNLEEQLRKASRNLVSTVDDD